MAVDETWPKFERNVSYSEESSLNTLDVCITRPPAQDDVKRLWVIYIHGGAWRDPEIDASSFETTQDLLLKSLVGDNIAGFASINYRLSPYPSHPSNPSNPSDPARNVKHPDHINDVLTAVLYLQETYRFQDRYVLVGHSCGATLALQVAMKRYWGSQYESTFALELNVEPPRAIVCLEGIYDLQMFVDLHPEQPVYKEIVHNAIGSSDWKAASPTNADFDDSWPDGELVIIAHSPDDQLITKDESEAMRSFLEAQGWNTEGERVVKWLEVKGDHDEVWQSGEASKAIEFAIQTLIGSS